MNRFRIGLILLIIGVALVLVGGISYTTQEKTKIGPIAIEHPEEHTIPYSPLAGALLAVTGGALMITGRAKSQQE
jgi:drug/metabolite transporter (DMT)-like permease